LENLSPNLSPARREALNSPPFVQKKVRLISLLSGKPDYETR